MSPAVKNVIMLVVLVLVVILAGWFFVRGDKESGYSGNLEESGTPWVCVKCGDHMLLSAQGVQEWMNSPDKCKKDSGSKRIVFWCEKCQDFTVVRGQWCEEDNIYYPLKDLQGNWMNCPSVQRQLDAEEQ